MAIYHRIQPLLASFILPLTLSITAEENLRLTGHVPGAVHQTKWVARLPETNHLDLAIGLPLRNQKALNELLVALYEPSNPSFHHYLSPNEFKKAFCPSEEDYQSVIHFAKANGLTVTRTHSNRMLLDVRGTVGTIEKALHVNLAVYPHPTEQRNFYSPDSEPVIDSSAPVLHISGLNNYRKASPRNLRFQPDTLRMKSTVNGSFVGNDFRKIYVPGVSLSGVGQIVGLVELDGYFAQDISAYSSLAGLVPEVRLENVLIDDFTGNPMTRSGNEEVALDIEMVVSMAPGLSKVLVYEASPTSTTANINDLFNRMATDNLAKQLSCSWGFDIDITTQQILQEFAAQGQSFFLASGDDGAFVNAVTQPADSPFVTVVGGTTVGTDSAGAWISETAWNRSGGGISTLYPLPDWQRGIDMSLNNGSTSMRNLPDIAIVAENVWTIADQGLSGSTSGTSISAPLWAAFTALVNEQAMANGQPVVGFLNPALYRIGKGTNYSATFHDILFGSNATESSPNKYLAFSGYDLCTGWGSPTGTNLINALLALPLPGLVITPPLGLITIGPVGGPFNQTIQAYTLTNTGAAPIEWNITNSAAWLEVFPSSGTLLPGGPATTIAVTVHPAITKLLLGETSANLAISDLSNGVVYNREFRLAVGNGNFESGDFTNWTLTAQEDVNFVDSLDTSVFFHGSMLPGIDDSRFVHTGIFGAFLGQNASPGTLSQTFTTVPGQEYSLSFWLDNPLPGGPNQFQVSWNGTRLFEQTDLRDFAWTNLQYSVTATGTDSVLEFRFQNDLNAFGLDDIVLMQTGVDRLVSLRVIAAPAEGGSVEGAGDFLIDSQQQISANPAHGWSFAGWNDGDQENPRTVTIPEGGAIYTARFIQMADLIVLTDPGNGGFVSGNGTYAVGTQQPIQAIAAPGWTFVGWSDGNQENPRSVTVPAGGATYTGDFAQFGELVVKAVPVEGGSVIGSGKYPIGSSQQILANPASGWSFTGWDDGSQDNPRSVIVPADGGIYSANFVSIAELSVGAEPVEGGTVTGGGNFPVGSQHEISALPAGGWSFVGWNDGNQESRRMVTVVTGATAYTALFKFAVQTPALSVYYSGNVLTLDVTGTGDLSYALQSSSDLATWSDLETLTMTEDGTAHTEITMTNTPNTFFRVIYRR